LLCLHVSMALNVTISLQTVVTILCFTSVTGADHDPFENPPMSKWSEYCFMSNLGKIKSCLKEDPTLLDRRESYLRYNGLLHVIFGAIFGAICKSPEFTYKMHPPVPMDDENLVINCGRSKFAGHQYVGLLVGQPKRWRSETSKEE
jgi:hypothetical protein